MQGRLSSRHWGARQREPGISRYSFEVPGSALRTTTSNPQHHLGDDLALDFRRAAEDRVGAAVEIFRHHRQHLLRHRWFVIEAVERTHRLDGEPVMTDHVDAEPRHRLAN